jgi:TonB-linked SusC/RagA family outer membrane protein
MKKQFIFRSVLVLALLGGLSPLTQAQQVTVTGKVTDNSGAPLEGATVNVKGASTHAITGKDGSFSISLPSERSLLLVSHVGYEEQQLAPGNQRLLSLTLKPNTNSLNEVVVIGYGTAKRREVTGAVTSLSGKGIEEKPISRVDQAMVGQMSGVQVRQQTGLPGQGLSIVVRGAGSITGGTEPLYVIDGFPLDVVNQSSSGGFSNNPLNNLNPGDIETIQVLKDASAAAIYGSRAANGVVMITTKRGQAGKPKIQVNVNSGVSSVMRKLDLLSADEWIAQATELANYRWVASGAGRTADQTNAQRRAILGLGVNAYNTNYMGDDRWSQPGHPGLQYIDWQDQAFQDAPFQNYQVSASGGSETGRYYFSAAYLNQDGVLMNSGYKNYATRANLELNASKRLKFGLNLAPTFSVTNTPSAEGKDNQLMKLYNMAPIVEDSAGLNSGAGKNNVYGWATSSVSPVAYFNNSIAETKTLRLLASIYGELQVLKGLSMRTSLNYDHQNTDTKRYTSDFVAGNITNYLTAPGKSASGSFGGGKKQTLVSENTFNYKGDFGRNHSFSALAGFSFSSVHNEAFTLSTAGGFANNVITTLNGAIASTAGVTVTGNTTESNNTMLSYFGRAQYSFKDRYMLQASFRRDASSRFGINSRWGTFPSLSAAWRISEESFMRRFGFINDLKLRGSWGRSGSSNIGDYSAQATLSGANYSFGGAAPVVATGIISNAFNPDLRWETSNTINGGIDLTVLNNRINLIVDVYRKKSEDLFLRAPYPSASGFSSLLSNVGSVLNTGLEFTLNTTNIRRKDFQWNTSANISFNKNRVLELNPEFDSEINVAASNYGGNPAFLLKPGLPMFSYYLIQSDGILTDKDVADPTVAKLSGQAVGDLRYRDANGDGRIDANDRVNAGQPNPKYTWGLTNTFKYKAFDLSVQVYGQHGGKIYSFLARAVDNPANGRATTLGVWRDRWTTENQNYSAPRGKIGYGYTIPYFTSDWLYSSDFWRVQDITAGFNVKSIVKSGFLSGARVYLSLHNFFGKDKYYGGVNPEAQNTNVGSGDYGLPGDYGAMPLTKTVTLGANISF